ncbi:MAG: DUF4340 domain-containing protein, partial [Spirochaetaceae bacterium]|nr:DUF4340 domain-containing protein [Spirochaetaceae bacterium]
TLSLKELPDTIVIKNKTNSEISLINTNGTWLLKDANENSENANMIIPANVETVKQMIDAISKINVLGLVSKNDDNERYGFSDNELTKVVVQKDGKVLRTLELGKNSSTYQQVYGKIDNSKDVLLISGNPKLTFDVTFEDLKAPVETAPENPVANSTAE